MAHQPEQYPYKPEHLPGERVEYGEENQRPFEPQDEQQLERTSADGGWNERRPAEAPPGRQVSGEPPAV